MPTLRTAVIGAWELVSFTVSDGSRPLGEHPQGLILYTDDGHMSAQLTDGTEHIAYGGRFTVDEASATVQHLVRIATMPDLLTQPQFRHAVIDGDLLTLSATTTTDGTTTDAVLVWRRAAQDSR